MKLFDEPPSVFDPEMVKEVLDTMVGLAADGMTIICVTREIGFAQQVADRVISLVQGAIVEEGEPSVLFRSPQHQRPRDFLGHFLTKHRESEP